MHHKSHTIMFALMGSLILVMLFSALGFSPRTEAQVPAFMPIKQENSILSLEGIKSLMTSSTPRTPEVIKAEIKKLVRANKPDEAKKLYDELRLATR